MKPDPVEAPSARYRKGQFIEAAVVDLGEADACFARLPDGLGVFIRGPVAVGDRVRAEITRIKKNYLEARCVELLALSPRRVNPACAHFGTCGGCKWQHVNYEEQLRLKHKRVVDALQHLGGFREAPCAAVLPAGRLYGYRNKIEFSFSRRRYLLADEGPEADGPAAKPRDFALGFHAPRLFDKVVDIDRCHIATDEMNRVLAVTRAFCLSRQLSVYSTRSHDGFLRSLVVRQSHATGEVMVNLVTSWHEEDLMAALREDLSGVLGGRLTTFVNNVTTRKNTAAVGEHEHRVWGPGFITEHMAGYRFNISANSFFQTNTRQAEALYGQVREMAGPETVDVAYDLYCGTGVIALVLAGSCRKVLGLEVVESALADARGSAALNGVTNCTFERLDLKDLKKAVPELTADGRPDVVVVDPPRAGVHPKALQAMLNLRPRRVVYVSCNPASLARDARVLREQGRYRLENVVPVDMFPHTNHIECVARMSLE